MAKLKTVATLPEELLTEILLRLPVKPLLRFRCVSKSLCNLIDSQNFIKRHLRRSMETRTNLHLIIQNEEIEIQDAHYPTEIEFVELNDEPLILKFLNNPLKSTMRYKTYIFGSCNGLLLLFLDDERLALWNPFTRRCKKLPVCPIEIPSESTYGLGHDSNRDDYKVVRIFKPNNPNFPFQVWVFSLKSNSWRRLDQDFAYTGYNLSWWPGCFADGSLHWLLKREGQGPQLPEMIVGFDVSNETFSRVFQPVHAPERFFSYLCILDGCLCMSLSSRRRRRDPRQFDYYVRRKEGDSFIWSKWYHFDKCYGQPMAYSRMGDKVLFDDGYDGAYWYDIKKKSHQFVDIVNKSFGYNVDVCWESLVSLGDDSEFDGAVDWRSPESVCFDEQYEDWIRDQDND